MVNEKHIIYTEKGKVMK